MKHLDEVNETYTQHALFALWAMGQLLLCAGTLAAHAVNPQVLTTSTSRRLTKLLHKMTTRYTK